MGIEARLKAAIEHVINGASALAAAFSIENLAIKVGQAVLGAYHMLQTVFKVYELGQAITESSNEDSPQEQQQGTALAKVAPTDYLSLSGQDSSQEQQQGTDGMKDAPMQVATTIIISDYILDYLLDYLSLSGQDSSQEQQQGTDGMKDAPMQVATTIIISDYLSLSGQDSPQEQQQSTALATVFEYNVTGSAPFSQEAEDIEVCVI
jgi:hypothetical protein